ncbi:MAG: zinc ribbon domain-containing protein [Oscillospiraceae bacterium]|nr:zinc ribbon domain-containing protein [Oscillospiraceae bacterium]
MKICPRCGTEQDDSALFCSNCGTTFAVQPPVTRSEPVEVPVVAQVPVATPVQPVQQPQYQQVPQYQVPVQTQVPTMAYNNYDHTSEFDTKEVSEYKLYAAVMYLGGFIGIAIALLANKESEYLKFHIKQVLKLTITEVILTVLTALLAWTIIVPIAGGIALVVLMVVNVIYFVNVLKNKSIEPSIVRSLKFLQ